MGAEPLNTSRLSGFERCALASGLLTQDHLEKAWAALVDSGSALSGDPPVSTDEQVANKLVQMGFLNFWQAQQLLAGRTKFNLGPYWIIDSIGRGGMGQVFKAQHGVMGRVVAVKVLPRAKSTPEAIANFNREIRAQARLDHDNLVRALDAGQDGNVYYLVTEYVPGADLRKLVRKSGPLKMGAAASIISQVAAGLAHAHEQGVIHRDVKPGNVLVTPEGHAKLSDLGLAGPAGGDAENDPRFGRIVGTADYLSPDHIQSPWNPKPTWDIYSLGCTLYYAVTGKVPFPGGSTADKANAHLKLRPLAPSRLNPSLSAPFVEVLAEMMAKDPADRIKSADEVIARLQPWVNSSAPGAADPSADASDAAEGVWPSGESSRGADAFEQDTNIPDTAISFPEFSDLTAGQRESPSQVSQGTQPVAAALDETRPELRMGPADAAGPQSYWWPLAVLVLFPLGLVGLILLVAWAARLL